MAITVTDRPSKELINGFLSKWSSSELPLQYDFESDKFPINKVDASEAITDLYYSSADLGVVIDLGAHNFQVNESVSISGTNTELDGGTFNVKKVTGGDVVLDFYTTETSNTGSALLHYNNYKGLVKVFSGAPDQHPYNLDGSKPLVEIGVLEVDFKTDGVDNLGSSNVNAYIKADITAQFDSVENSHYAWTSFHIQTAETYDTPNGTFTSTFIDDLQLNCTTFSDFNDASFANGLNSWNQSQINGLGAPWGNGVGKVVFGSITSNVLNQDKTIYAGVTYDLSFRLTVNDLGDNNRIIYSYWVYNGVDWSRLTYGFITSLGTQTIDTNINTSNNYEKIGVRFEPDVTTGTIDIELLDFNISTNVGEPCLFVQFANFGAKQFQDSLGGNFGDYVLAPVGDITPKILTHFEEKTFFDNKPFYFSAIIPDSTFSLSQGGNTLYLAFTLFDRTGTITGIYQYQVQSKSDGVYTVDLTLTTIPNEWITGNVQFVIIPDNKFSDADFGTFENQTTTGITIYPNNGGNNPDQIGFNINVSGFGYESSYGGQVNTNANIMTDPSKEYFIFKNDTLTTVIEGETYVLEAYISMTYTFEPSQLDNGSLFLLPDGYTKEECTITYFDIIEENLYSTPTPVDSDWVKITTTFVAKSNGTLFINFKELLKEDINLTTGFAVNIDTITFKGPIEYISEKKAIKKSSDCSCYGGTLRWLNDLGGWESWFFTSPKTVSETVTGKINVLNDLTSNWDASFIDGDTQNDTIKTTSNQTITLNSQLLTKDEYKNLQQIKRSARVQILMDSGKWQTVTVKKGGYEIAEDRKDIYEMSITVNLPDTVIQAQ
jgi:hypothetical protein